MPTVPSVSIQSPAARVLEDLLHALNQPLTHIRCTMELMLYRSLAPGDDREKLAALLKQAEKASKLSTAMQQVLEIEREHRAGPQRAALATAVEIAFEDFNNLTACWTQIAFVGT